jgi:hypothetical protein
MKRVLVTEINSPLDQQLVEYLVSENYIVRIIVKEINAGSPLLRLPLEIFSGNLSDPESVAQSAKGCQYIIQTAPADRDDEPKVSMVGLLHQSLNVIEAAAKVRAKTLIHITRPPVQNPTVAPAAFDNGTEEPGVVAIPLSLQPGMHQLLLQALKPKLKTVFIQLGDDTSAAQSINAGNRPLTVVKEIMQALLKGKNGHTYLIGQQAKIHLTFLQSILSAITNFIDVFRKALSGIKVNSLSKVHKSGQWMGITIFWQHFYLAFLFS